MNQRFQLYLYDLIIIYAIPHSFTIVRKEDKNYQVFYQGLSNGPQEGFNRKPKDMKKLSRGFSNFAYVRNRILWSSRKDASILAVPKDYKEIANPTGIKRGPYGKDDEIPIGTIEINSMNSFYKIRIFCCLWVKRFVSFRTFVVRRTGIPVVS